MKYESMVAMHKRHHEMLFLSFYENFKPKESYTAYDFMSYLPGNLFYFLVSGLIWIYTHRPKLVIVKSKEAS